MLTMCKAQCHEIHSKNVFAGSSLFGLLHNPLWSHECEQVQEALQSVSGTKLLHATYDVLPETA